MEKLIKSLLKKVHRKLAEFVKEHAGSVPDGEEWGIDEWRQLHPEYDVEAIIKILTLHHVKGQKPKAAIQSVNPAFHSAGSTLIRGLERKLAHAVVAGDMDCLRLIQSVKLRSLLRGHPDFVKMRDEQLEKLDRKAAGITEKVDDTEAGVAASTTISVRPSAEGPTEVVVEMGSKGQVSREKRDKITNRAMDTRSNILHERCRRAALKRWEAVREGPSIPEVVIDDVWLAHILDLRKRYGKGAFGLLPGVAVPALGDGQEALQGLLYRLDSPQEPVIRKWYEKLVKEGYTPEVATSALAAFFLMLHREKEFPKKPKKDAEGIIREHSAMDLYEFANNLKDPDLHEDKLRYAYWWLTERRATVQRDLEALLPGD